MAFWILSEVYQNLPDRHGIRICRNRTNSVMSKNAWLNSELNSSKTDRWKSRVQIHHNRTCFRMSKNDSLHSERKSSKSDSCIFGIRICQSRTYSSGLSQNDSNLRVNFTQIKQAGVRNQNLSKQNFVMNE